VLAASLFHFGQYKIAEVRTIARARSGGEMKIAIEDVNFDSAGLIPAIVQDAVTLRVLTLAYMMLRVFEEHSRLVRHVLVALAFQPVAQGRDFLGILSELWMCSWIVIAMHSLCWWSEWPRLPHGRGIVFHNDSRPLVHLKMSR